MSEGWVLGIWSEKPQMELSGCQSPGGVDLPVEQEGELVASLSHFELLHPCPHPWDWLRGHGTVLAEGKRWMAIWLVLTAEKPLLGWEIARMN